MSSGWVRSGMAGRDEVYTAAMRLSVALLIAAAFAAPLGAERGGWPGFRGPAANGLSPDTRAPLTWSATENVKWAAEIPGRGWSSPVIWKSRVYLTTAIGAKPFKQPSPGLYGNDYIAELRKQGLSDDEVLKRVRQRDNEAPEESDEIRYVVLALDAGSGKPLWEREAHKGLPSGGRHRKNTYASETPVTDGERLYVSFGQNIGLFAYTLDGELLWKQQWPPTRIYLDFGTASSPVVHGGRVFVQQDSEDGSYLTALDAKTGRQLWRTTREYEGFLKSSWSTPLVWAHAGRTEIVTTGHGMIRSYSVETGAELWRIAIAGITMPTPSPLVANGVLYVGTGAQNGEGSRPFFAIRPGASGDITPKAGQTGNAFVVWTQAKASGYTPSALVHDNRVYLVHDTGVMGVYAADTGRELFKARVGGVGHTFSASPVAVGNRLYFLDEEGTTIVLEAGDSYKELAQNALDEMTLASPAVAEGSLFIRTETKLYRIG
jgi:outer membrane protein assembly factor BamB